MKKIIIVAFAAFTGLSSLAQEKKYDVNGYEIGKAPVINTQDHGNSITATNSNIDVNGVDKTVAVIPEETVVQNVQPSIVTLTDASGRPVNAKVDDKTYQVKELQAPPSNDNKNYRSKGDISANPANNETYIRSTAEDHSGQNTPNVQEIYTRDQSIVEPKQETPQLVSPTNNNAKSGNSTK